MANHYSFIRISCTVESLSSPLTTQMFCAHRRQIYPQSKEPSNHIEESHLPIVYKRCHAGGVILDRFFLWKDIDIDVCLF